jgi:hypothetical protein
MILIDNAGAVLRQAWSIRLSVLSAVFGAAEVALPFFTDFVPPRTMALIAVFTAAGAAAARLVAQPGLTK